MTNPKPLAHRILRVIPSTEPSRYRGPSVPMPDFDHLSMGEVNKIELLRRNYTDWAIHRVCLVAIGANDKLRYLSRSVASMEIRRDRIICYLRENPRPSTPNDAA